MSNEKAFPDFASAQTILAGGEMPISPAECHGLLTGFLAAGSELKEQGSLEPVFGSLQTGDAGVRDFVLDLFSQTSSQLGSVSFDFQLLLPSDDAPIVERSKALCEWCQGFLTGLGLAGISENSIQQAESKEALQDIAEIAKLEETDIPEEEESEVAYADICEYVRMAALMIYTELCKPEQFDGGDNSSQKLH